MKKFINLIFPKKSKWIDIGCYERKGTYYLLQMRYEIESNKKEFCIATMGFINDYNQKDKLFSAAIGRGE